MSTLHGFRGYSDYRDMLESESLDIVCVLVPVNLHREVTVACAEAGVHVFCEKPIAITLADAQQMVSVCGQRGVKFFYGASYRFLPAVRKARELIAAGAIGDVLLLTESILGGSGPDGFLPMGTIHYPQGGPGGSGLGLVDHGVHMIDLFPWLAGSEIVSISGRGNISGETPSTEHVNMILSNGATGQLLYNDGTFDTDLPAEGIFSHGLPGISTVTSPLIAGTLTPAVSESTGPRVPCVFFTTRIICFFVTGRIAPGHACRSATAGTVRSANGILRSQRSRRPPTGGDGAGWDQRPTGIAGGL